MQWSHFPLSFLHIIVLHSFFQGELIGVEYLYSQTGQVLQDLTPEDPDSAVDSGLETPDQDDEDEGFQVRFRHLIKK